MPNVTGGLRRVWARIPSTTPRPSSAALLRIAGRLRAPAVPRDRIVPLTVAGLVLIASMLSVAPASGVRGSGNADATGGMPRLIVGGGVLGRDTVGPDGLGARSATDTTPLMSAPPALGAEQGAAMDDTALDSRYLPDGTPLRPVTVDGEVSAPQGRLVDYYVKQGDTLTGIAHDFGISMMTLWWANRLTSKDELHVGQHLLVPPVDGLVVVVKAGDTLDAIASAAHVDAGVVADYNGLIDGDVAVGQTLILPGAVGAAIPTPAPTPKPKSTTTTKTTKPAVATAPSTRYSGGKFSFPLPGHSIAQYYHYGHYGIDIAGSTGDAVHAAAAGTVIYAGWRNNGGGLVVWISHGSGLYTTYNHMSAVLVHTGQRVSRGQVVGRVGMTGWATGPHLHFEVWLNGVPGGVDRRVNPLRYF